MLASARPELCGPIIVAGAPLSYWAGVRGENPMRYTGGLYGGSWLTALAVRMAASISSRRRNMATGTPSSGACDPAARAASAAARGRGAAR